VKTCTVCGTEWSDDTRFCPNDGSTLRSVGAADLIGGVIGRYHVVRKLGEGGMGTVYLGEHVKMGRKDAIKVMARSMANDPEAIARFNREAANAAKITHPNVCAVYDYGETDDGLIYLAMELIEGESLSAVLRRQNTLAPQRAVQILHQTADALQAAHDLGIVHRDLKPDNIMLTRGRSGAEVVKVVDFGIAKAMTGEEGQQVTKTGLVVGTPEYMSPEQLSGDVLDGRSDIYSLALVFYRMLTGTLPFQAGTAQETMIKRLTDDPLPLNDAVPGASFPATLQAVLDRALARMPSDRYAGALTFASDATRAVAGMAPTAGATVAEAATQLLGTSPTDQLPDTRISEASTRSPATTPQTPLPSASPARAARISRRWPAVVGAVAVVAVGGGTAYLMVRGGGEPLTQLESATPSDPGRGGGQPSTPGDTTLGTAAQQQTSAPTSEPARDPSAPPERPGAGGAEPREAVSAPDLGAVTRALDAFADSVLEETATPTARRWVEDIYGDRTLPDSLRVRAALRVGDWFALIGVDYPTACRWYRQAQRLAPDDPAVTQSLNSPACRGQ